MFFLQLLQFFFIRKLTNLLNFGAFIATYGVA
jgi:hypothetical protein